MIFIIKIAKSLSYFFIFFLINICHAEKLRDPFSKVDITDSREINLSYNLKDYALSELQLVGTITEDTISWAVIRDPQGKYYQVHSNEIFGSEQARIIAIHNETILASYINPENNLPTTITINIKGY